MKDTNLKKVCKSFKWKHFEPDIILWAVRWYLRYPISYRDLQEMMLERGLTINHTTPYRWVQQYAPALDKKMRPYLKQTNSSWHCDETYVKIKSHWHYLYRAIDRCGNTLDWMLSKKRNKKAAKNFFKKILSNNHCKKPRTITVDKNKAFPPAVIELKIEHEFASNCKLQRIKYLNNIQEQDHRFIKRMIKNNQWFQSFNTAKNTIAGFEAMHMIKKGQIRYIAANDPIAQKQFIERLFGIAA